MTCHKTVIGVSRGRLHVKDFSSNISSFLCQFNFFKITKLSQHSHESDHPSLMEILLDLNSDVCLSERCTYNKTFYY